MLTVTTSDGAVYSIDYLDLNGRGQRLAVERHGTQEQSEDEPHMRRGRWYLLNALLPTRPLSGNKMILILNSLDAQATAPVIRRTSMVMSVVGMI